MSFRTRWRALPSLREAVVRRLPILRETRLRSAGRAVGRSGATCAAIRGRVLRCARWGRGTLVLWFARFRPLSRKPRRPGSAAGASWPSPAMRGGPDRAQPDEKAPAIETGRVLHKIFPLRLARRSSVFFALSSKLRSFFFLLSSKVQCFHSARLEAQVIPFQSVRNSCAFLLSPAHGASITDLPWCLCQDQSPIQCRVSPGTVAPGGAGPARCRHEEARNHHL